MTDHETTAPSSSHDQHHTPTVTLEAQLRNCYLTIWKAVTGRNTTIADVTDICVASIGSFPSEDKGTSVETRNLISSTLDSIETAERIVTDAGEPIVLKLIQRASARQAALDHYRKQRRKHPTSQLSQRLG